MRVPRQPTERVVLPDSASTVPNSRRREGDRPISGGVGRTQNCPPYPTDSHILSIFLLAGERPRTTNHHISPTSPVRRTDPAVSSFGLLIRKMHIFSRAWTAQRCRTNVTPVALEPVAAGESPTAVEECAGRVLLHCMWHRHSAPSAQPASQPATPGKSAASPRSLRSPPNLPALSIAHFPVPNPVSGIPANGFPAAGAAAPKLIPANGFAAPPAPASAPAPPPPAHQGSG